ncbi:UvrD-helicase domain-containing protein [candidate division KSB1 bacterium]|nr:UvrD-helicase domain-containing protein [candidate division KSB1 bacterium]
MSEKKFFPTLFQHLATDTARNLIISAGAGAGKTAVLTRRVIKILKEEQLSLNRLMVVTFTDKAAVEMKERVYAAIEREIQREQSPHFKRLRDDFLKNRISTFHAFCAALLREYPIEAQIDPYFRVLDETDKIFLLRRVIERSLNELAEDKNHPALARLNSEWSRTTIVAMIYTLIQNREDTGVWLRDFQNLQWETFQTQLAAYHQNFLREICFKASLRPTLKTCYQRLQHALPEPPDDDSKLSLRRLEILTQLPQLIDALNAARDETRFDAAQIQNLVRDLTEACNLSGSNAKAWANVPENLDRLRIGMLMLRNFLETLQLEEFDLNWPVELNGYHLVQALARVAIYCLDAYRTEKDKEHYLDFQDLQLKVLTLLSHPKHAHILHELRENYLYIMVDEFQDTNALQWEIIRLIASDEQARLFGNRLFIVGDEKQAIYSFRGGDVTLFNKVKRTLVQTNQERGTFEKAFILSASGEFEKDYAAEYQVKLPEDRAVRAGEIIFSDNFRSAAAPIDFFNLFFQKLMGKEYLEDFEAAPQPLRCAGNQHEGSVELLLVDRDATSDDALQTNTGLEETDLYTKEAHLIALKIKEVLSGDDPKYDYIREQARASKPTIAILLNRRTKLKIYEEALRRESIDFIVVRGRGFFQRQEIMDFGNLLGFLVDPTNSIYLNGFLRSPIGHISDEGLYLVTQFPHGNTLWEKLNSLLQMQPATFLQPFRPVDWQALQAAFERLQRWLSLARRLVLVDFLRLVLDEGGFYASLARGNRGEQALSNIEKLLDRARAATLNPQEDLLTFTNWLNERIDYVDEEGEADVDVVLGGVVQLMTVHQSKGLEFPMVFIPDLSAHFNFGEREALRFDQVTTALNITPAGLLLREQVVQAGVDAPDPANNFEATPTLIKKIIERRNREKTIAERKRLFYVAATRAMDHLVLVGQLKRRDRQSQQTELATELDQLNNWMDWLSKILMLTEKIEGASGTVLLGDPHGIHLKIPYHLYDENQSILNFVEQWRTDFPV